MTIDEKALQIIEEITGRDAALAIIAALAKKRISFVTLTASVQLFTRFHAHCRYLGSVVTDADKGYEHFYRLAVDHAMELNDWPLRIEEVTVPITYEIAGETIKENYTTEVARPASSRKANNRQILTAYSVITDEARRRGIELPEN